MKRVYLASPYSHAHRAIVLRRVALVAMMTADLNERGGINCYSPIVHGHNLPHSTEIAKSDAFWKPFNEDEIRRSDELWVLELDGWRESVGVKREIEYAASIGKPVCFVTPGGVVSPGQKWGGAK